MNGHGISLPTGDPFAGFWRRAGAWFVDALVIYTTYLLIAFFIWDDLLMQTAIQDPDSGEVFYSYIPSLLGLLLVGVATLAYFAFQESSRAQATLGKRAFKIRVCNYNGDKISLLTAGYRAWPLWLPGLINTVAILDLVVGLASLLACLVVAFTKRKQGLHDMMSRCLVVKRRAVFSNAPGPQV
jgi:uncharacterized RDD family membrane protein YckC